MQIIMDNMEYLNRIGYFSNAEQAFLLQISSYLEFKTNVIIEKGNNNEIETSRIFDRSEISFNIIKKSILETLEAPFYYKL